MSLKERVANGLSWSVASRISSQAFQFVFQITLARLLSPNEFGTVGMLLVLIGFAQTVADFGLSSALIYEQEVSDVKFSTVFWLQVIAAAHISVLFYFAAPLIAGFYAAPILDPLTRFVAPIFVVQAIGQTHSALLSKNFEFKKLAVCAICSTFLSGGLAVFLALRGYGVWALAWQSMAAAAVSSLLLWLQSGWHPILSFSLDHAKRLGKYGIYLLGHGGLNYWLRNADKLAIGKFIGAHELGIYSRAYGLMLLPLNNISAVLGQVMFPTLAQLQNDPIRFRIAYLTATRMIALVSFPLMAGVAVLCDPLILFLLGEKWIEVVPILQVLSVVGLMQSIVFPVGWIFTSLGKTREQFHLSIILSCAFVGTVGIGLVFGVLGVAYAYAAWTILSGYLNLRIAGGYIGVSPSTILLSTTRIVGMTVAMAIFVFAVDQAASTGLAPSARLLAGTLIGVTSYGIMCLFSKDPASQQLLSYVSARRRRRTQA